MDLFQGKTPPNYFPLFLGEQNTENLLTPDDSQFSIISAAEFLSDNPIQSGQTQRSTGSVDSDVDGCHPVC